MDHLLKFDLKETSRFMLPLLFFDLCFCLAYYFGLFSMALPEWSQPFVFLFLISVLMGNWLLFTVLMLVHYYRWLYGRGAYWTHSLPVTTADKLNSKVFVYMFWSFWISIATLVMSYMVIDYILMMIEDSDGTQSIDWTGLAQSLREADLPFVQLVLLIAVLLLCVLFMFWLSAVSDYFMLSVAARIFSGKTIVFGFVLVSLVLSAFYMLLEVGGFYLLPYFLVIDYKSGHFVFDFWQSADRLYFTAVSEAPDASFAVIYCIMFIVIGVVCYGLTRLLIGRRKDIGH